MLLWPVALVAVCIPCLADMCLPFLLPHPVRVKPKELLLPDLHSRQACSTTTVSENSWLKVGERQLCISLKYKGESRPRV